MTDGSDQATYNAGATQGWNHTAEDQLGGAGFTNEGADPTMQLTYNKSVTAN